MNGGGTVIESENRELQEFLQGVSRSAHNYFGVHEERDGFVFRTFAPRATQVMLTGDFNGWRDDVFLSRVDSAGVWEVKLPIGRINYGDRYKYRIYGHGQLHYKSDPFALSMPSDSDNSSAVVKPTVYPWKDSGWLNYRRAYHKNASAKPVNIYELHLGSWKKKGRNGYLNYRDYARELAPYVKQMGYTHVCLLPINEHSSVASRYSPSSFFAPSSRYGSMDDLKAFVDKLHEAGIGVIFDVPIFSFPRERYGLFEYDGAPLYESACGDKKCYFDFSKGEARSFITSSVTYWISEYHADAIRISDVDNAVKSGLGDTTRRFLKELLKNIKKTYPDVLLIADKGSEVLGFDFAFDCDWSNRILKYASIEFEKRAENHHLLTDMLECNTSAVSISHRAQSEDVSTLIESSAGDYWQKFAGARALLGLTLTMHGKKLCFMGNDIAQFRKWDAERETEWFLLEYESHEKLQRYLAELNNLYLSHPALWQRDASPESLCLVDRGGFEQNVIIFRRIAKDEELTVVINLAPIAYEEYRIGAERRGSFYELLNSDDSNYYGSGVINRLPIATEEIEYHGYKNSFCMRVPPLAISILGFKPTKNKKTNAI